MRIQNCSFCSAPVYPGHGSVYVRNDSKLFRYCSSKCDKISRHKKNPRKTRWTKSFRKINGKELTIDPTFEFERKRNMPVKYNREKWSKAIDVMKQVSDIREKREGKFVMDRLRAGRKITLQEAKVTVRRHINVIKPAAAGLKYKPKKTSTEKPEESTEGKTRQLEDRIRSAELNEEDEVLPRLLQMKRQQTEDSDEEGSLEAPKPTEGKARILEEAMEIEYDDSDDTDDDEDSDDE